MMWPRLFRHLALGAAALGSAALAGEHSAPRLPGDEIVLAQTEGAAVEGVGVVVAVDPDTTRFGSATLTVDHEDIPGFMGAMEMMYSVSSPDLLDGLEAGDRIHFTIDTLSVTINSIEVLPD